MDRALIVCWQDEIDWLVLICCAEGDAMFLGQCWSDAASLLLDDQKIEDWRRSQVDASPHQEPHVDRDERQDDSQAGKDLQVIQIILAS